MRNSALDTSVPAILRAVIRHQQDGQLQEAHPFIEHNIGLCRQEFLDHVLFWNAEDLAKKLGQYQNYHNETRAHSSLNKKAPNQKAANDISNKVVPMENIRWKSHCRGLFNLPVAA